MTAAEFSSDARRTFMLAGLRVARARVQLLALEIEEIGVALNHDIITPEDAVAWLDYIDALQFVNVEPWPTKIEMSA